MPHVAKSCWLPEPMSRRPPHWAQQRCMLRRPMGTWSAALSVITAEVRKMRMVQRCKLNEHEYIRTHLHYRHVHNMEFDGGPRCQSLRALLGSSH
eukprot:4610367-Amphidinium_carterae.1